MNEHEFDIYRQEENLWVITGKKDRVLIYMFDGEIEFYRLTDVCDLVIPRKKRQEE